MSIASAIYPKLGYHPTKSFVPLTMIANFPLILAIPAGASRQDRAGTGRLDEGQSGQVELRDILARLHDRDRTVQAENRRAGRRRSRTRAAAKSLVAVMGGQTLLTIADGPPTVPLVKGGKVRALAVTGSERSAELPDVPSMKEAGLPT